MPLIKAHNADDNYVFWPDLASSHNARTVTECYTAHDINFVKKVDNPPAVPECRPIEDFWGYFKRQSVREQLASKRREAVTNQNKVMLEKN